MRKAKALVMVSLAVALGLGLAQMLQVRKVLEGEPY